jgi:hypothetical protein
MANVQILKGKLNNYRAGAKNPHLSIVDGTTSRQVGVADFEGAIHDARPVVKMLETHNGSSPVADVDVTVDVYFARDESAA